MSETIGTMPCCGNRLLNPPEHTIWCEHHPRNNGQRDTLLENMSHCFSEYPKMKARIAELEAKLENSLVLERGRFDQFHKPLIDGALYLLFADTDDEPFWNMGFWYENTNGWLDMDSKWEYPEGSGGVITEWYGPLEVKA